MIIEFLSSISKVAIVAFLFTFIAILIELFIISRRGQSKKTKKEIILPDFTHGIYNKAQLISDDPVKIKKTKVESAPHQISPTYVFGLIAVCGVVFIIAAVAIMYRDKQDVVVEEQVFPTRPQRPTVSIAPTLATDQDEVALLDFEEENLAEVITESSDQAEILAQAPSPTGMVLPTATLVPTVIIATTVPSLSPTQTVFVTSTPTATLAVTKKPTLLQTGGSYQASMIGLAISFALIAVAFIF